MSLPHAVYQHSVTCTKELFVPRPPCTKLNLLPPGTHNPEGSCTCPTNVGTCNPHRLTCPAQDSNSLCNITGKATCKPCKYKKYGFEVTALQSKCKPFPICHVLPCTSDSNVVLQGCPTSSPRGCFKWPAM